MSNISHIIDRIPVVMGTLFPLKTRFAYPYSIEKNNSRLMVNGYGILYGSAVFEPLEACGFVNNRQISIVFTKSIYRLESDSAKIDSVLKEMMEDVYTVQKHFYNNSQLDISDKIAKVDIVAVSAPEEVNADKESFWSMQADFNFWIYEKL